ncbi:MAG: hypothetical protein JSV03_08420 [Planctomycetota bacterium]|nr:MAG: hypothetical protein JSV03_08420 [Planctomycetota bacterium]
MLESLSTIAAWKSSVASALAEGQNEDGGWGYYTSQTSSTEPTSLALLALSLIEPDSDSLDEAENWLIASQRQDGFFITSPTHSDISWLTPLAGLALNQRARTSAVQAASQALLSEPVYTFVPLVPNVYGYDTSIPGWPWTAGAFSFVVPTSLAVIFLKKTGYWNESRVRQGIQLLNNRVLADGGWNYGEPKVLGGDLYPAVLPTALVLLALAGEQNDQTEVALNWLLSQRGQISSLMSLGWATITLNVLGLLDDNWRNNVMNRWNELPANRRGPMEASLCLLGLADNSDHLFAVT